VLTSLLLPALAIAGGTTSAAASVESDAPPSEVSVVFDNGNTVTLPIDEVAATDVVSSSAGSGDLSELEGAFAIKELEIDPGLLDDLERLNTPSASPAPDDDVVTPQVIIGSDDRVRVWPDHSPLSQMPLLLFKRNGENYMCSGALVGPRTVITAGHCLYSADTSTPSWSTEISVLFGVDGTTANFGCYPSQMGVGSTWMSNAAASSDWGVIQLACNAGAVVGHMGYKDPGISPNQDFGFQTITGYPSDKVDSNGYQMWMHTNSVYALETTRISYSIDTMGGQSGAPIWRLESGTACGNCVMGVHTSGSSFWQQNYGVRTNLGFKSTIDYVNSL
jgi:glutamyl endopeptidase